MKANPNRFWFIVILLGWVFDFLFWKKPVRYQPCHLRYTLSRNRHFPSCKQMGFASRGARGCFCFPLPFLPL